MNTSTSTIINTLIPMITNIDTAKKSMPMNMLTTMLTSTAINIVMTTLTPVKAMRMTILIPVLMSMVHTAMIIPAMIKHRINTLMIEGARPGLTTHH